MLRVGRSIKTQLCVLTDLPTRIYKNTTGMINLKRVCCIQLYTVLGVCSRGHLEQLSSGGHFGARQFCRSLGVSRFHNLYLESTP